MDPKPHEVAKMWLRGAAGTSWPDALASLASSPPEGDPSVATLKARMKGAMDSLVPVPYLVVTGGKVWALHAFRRCQHLGNDRGLGLLGEREASAEGALYPPKVYRVGGGHQRTVPCFPPGVVPVPLHRGCARTLRGRR